MKSHSIAFSMTVVVFALGCSKRGNPATQSQSAQQTMANGSATVAPAAAAPQKSTLSVDDKNFVLDAAQAGMVEVARGRDASQRSTSSSVKTFANRVVTDQDKSDDELTALAKTKGVAVPDSLDKANQAKLEAQSKLKGSKLDDAYARDTASDQNADVEQFQKASQTLNDPDLRAWATKTLPVIQNHLTMAKDIDANAKNAKTVK